jgi:hypothetical protein
MALLLSGLLLLTACSSPAAAPATATRAPLLPAERTAKPTRPPVGAQIAPTELLESPATDEPLATLESLPPVSLDELLDDFSDPDSGWDINSGQEGAVGYEDDEYVIQVDEVDYTLWANPSVTFGDVLAGVTAQLADDSAPADMGVICRYQDVQNFVYGEITSDGYYGINQVKDGDLTILTGDGKLQPSDVIRQGEANRIEFLCAGRQFALFVDEQFVDAIEADAPAEGDVGLIAGTFERPGARVRFDDFSAVLPPPGTEIGAVQPGSSVLYADDFSDSQSGWDERETENGATGYRDGRYFIRVTTPKYQLWSSPGESFEGNVVVEVIAGLASGPEENEMGVICRYQDRQNFMYASVGTDGYYAIVEIKDDEVTILTGEGKFQLSDAIPAGSDTYVVRLACKGDRYTLFVNGEEIDSASSSAFTGGDVGVLAGTFEQDGVEVLFDDFNVSGP